MSNGFVRDAILRIAAAWMWFPVGLILYIVCLTIYLALAGAVPDWVFNLWKLLWVLVFLLLLWRISNLRCPKCGNRALKPTPIIIGKIRCRHCGYPNDLT
jgi:hypothetical protein